MEFECWLYTSKHKTIVPTHRSLREEALYIVQMVARNSPCFLSLAVYGRAEHAGGYEQDYAITC